MADKNCKTCKGTGKKYYIVSKDGDVDDDICDCILEEGTWLQK